MAAARRDARAGAKAEVLLGGSPAAAAGVGFVEDYSHLGVASVSVPNQAALDVLAATPGVSVHANEALRMELLQSLPLISQPQAAAKGYNGTAGAGQECYIVVADTGANYTVADLGNCTEPGVPSSCRVAAMYELADVDDNQAEDASDVGRSHGTNVASIAARVAPGAKLIVMDIFEPDGTAWLTTILRAVNKAVALKVENGTNICAINLSVGGVTHIYPNAPCDSRTDVEGAFKGATDEGIAVVVASGNEAKAGFLGVPACARSAISVGAVWDSDLGTVSPAVCAFVDTPTYADKVTCFTNTAKYMSLLAPGGNVLAGGVSQRGTSQAAPHVAGAIAVLKALKPAATVDEMVTALKTTGKLCHLPQKPGFVDAVIPRINLEAAAELIRGAPLPLDRTPPGVPTVVIAGGASVTTSRNVSLEVVASDEPGGSGIELGCYTNDAAVTHVRCWQYRPFLASRFWDLGDAPGPKTVRVFVVDREGNTQPVAGAATITYDPNYVPPPPPATLVIAGGAPYVTAAAVTLTMTGSAFDANTEVCVSETAAAPENCKKATWKPWSQEFAYKLAGSKQGPRALKAFFRAKAGAPPLPAAQAAAAASTVLDSKPPKMKSQGKAWTAAPTAGAIAVAFSRSEALAGDVTSGLAAWRLVLLKRGPGVKALSGCASPPAGAVPADFNATGDPAAHTFSGLDAGSTYQLRLCAVDKAGLWAKGQSKTVKTPAA
ncbi:MAG: peptidase S8/S53 domain-containing protein [Monoraphidium minutum]|nr:MAG: peptidase S8/S53 domain-containing protein [Monoraphidium minutum]